jgi:hypothetical protein
MAGATFQVLLAGQTQVRAAFVGSQTFVGAPSSGQTSASHTLTFSFDAADAGRWLLAIVIFTAAGTGGTSPQHTVDVTIGGIAATQLFYPFSGETFAGFYVAKVPTNVDQTVKLTVHGVNFADSTQTGVALYHLAGVGASVNATNPPGFLVAAANTGKITATATIPDASAVVGVSLNTNGTAGGTATHTWSGLVEDVDVAIDASWDYSAAHINIDASQPLTVTDQLSQTPGTTEVGTFVVFSP